MAGQHSHLIKPIYFIGDILIIKSAFLLSCYLLFHGFDKYVAGQYAILQLIINFSWVIAITSIKAYKLYRVQTIITITGNALRLLVLYFVMVEVLNGVLNTMQQTRILLYYFYGFTGVAIILWRITSTISLRILRRKGYNYRRVIIAGMNDATKDIVDFFNIHPEHGYRLLKTFDLKEYKGDFTNYIGALKSFCLENNVDEIYCSMSEFNLDQLNYLKDFSEKEVLRLKFVLNPLGLNFKDFKIDFYGYLPVYIFRSIPLDDQLNKVIKRSFDILFSLLIFLFIFSWLFPVIAIIIKLNSKGPVFFKQKRTGLGNEDFWCWKFRTMHVNQNADVVQATKQDARITSTGGFFRRHSIDELPQFFNVLLGNMSVVGPRPHMLKHTEEYSEIIDKYMVRHFIKPGITGLAQVKGYRGETITPDMMERRIKLDIFYMENWSFLLDIKIIFLTVWNILREEENAG